MVNNQMVFGKKLTHLNQHRAIFFTTSKHPCIEKRSEKHFEFSIFVVGKPLIKQIIYAF